MFLLINNHLVANFRPLKTTSLLSHDEVTGGPLCFSWGIFIQVFFCAHQGREDLLVAADEVNG